MRSSTVAVACDYPEVIVALIHLLTPGREIIAIERPEDIGSLKGAMPGAFIVPLFRQKEAIARPIGDFCQDVGGARLLKRLNQIPLAARPPVIVFAFGVHPEEVPAELGFSHFITFPQAIQELNPLVSALVGPAPQAKAS